MVAGDGKKFISPQPTGYSLELKIIFARLRVKYQKCKRIQKFMFGNKFTGFSLTADLLTRSLVLLDPF